VTFSTYDYGSSSIHGVALSINWEHGGESHQLRLANGGQHIETFEFADGSVVGRIDADFDASGLARILGTSGDDVMVGGDGRDYFRGGDGDDTLLPGGSDSTSFQYMFGEEGNDTYQIGNDIGRVWISNYGEDADTGTADRVVFTDLALADVTFSTYDYGSSSIHGVALSINWEHGGESHQLRLANGGQHIETFEFA
ncbi:MAG: hypothetical protein GY754_21360, partial [bacterium]|nr:hypothetical protein [bacterium]